MSRPRNPFQHQLQEDTHISNPNIARSPLRRAPFNQNGQPKSPLRSRTPVRPVSPLSHHHILPSNIRYIANVSPLKQRAVNFDNHTELSNGKNLKYINASKTERNFQTARKNESTRPIERTQPLPQDNRLFSRIVDKLNSEKKAPSHHSNKASFLDADSTKPRVDPSLRPSGTFKQLVSLAKAGQTKSQIKPRVEELPSEDENLSCLVYRVKSPRGQAFERQLSQIPNHCSPTVIRKPSSHQQALKESIEDYGYLDILLEKMNAGCVNAGEHTKQDEEVRGSLNVRESLSMDPFL